MNFRTARGRIFLFILLVLSLPLLQYNLNVITSGKLYGAIVSHPNIQFSFKKWWDGEYQAGKTEYLNDSTGFRPDLIRMNNQIDYTLFNKLHSGDEYMGYHHNIFGKGYTDEYGGIMYTSDEILRDKLIKLKKIQDTLQRLGKTFIFAYSPSKAYYYADEIPPILKPINGGHTSDYFTTKRLADSLHINQLDFNLLFLKMKDTAVNLLMPKLGIHWSFYGSLLAADTLIKRVESERKIKMPELKILQMHYSDTARFSDADIGSTTNLIFPIVKERYCYPDFRYGGDTGAIKPRAIYVGDSFIWLWIYDGLMQHANSTSDYWEYFLHDWNETGEHPIDNWETELDSADYIVFMLTPMNLYHLAGKDFFVEQCYKHFYPTASYAK